MKGKTTSENWRIRRASTEDAQTIALIHVLSWQKTYQGILPNEYLENLCVEKREQMWQKNLTEKRSHVLVLSIQNDILGFAAWHIFSKQHEIGELNTLYLHPNHWRKGLGLALFDATKTAMREHSCQKIQLWVAAENRNARAFYEKIGLKLDNKTKTETIGTTPIKELCYRLDLISST